MNPQADESARPSVTLTPWIRAGNREVAISLVLTLSHKPTTTAIATLWPARAASQRRRNRPTCSTSSSCCQGVGPCPARVPPLPCEQRRPLPALDPRDGCARSTEKQEINRFLARWLDEIEEFRFNEEHVLGPNGHLNPADPSTRRAGPAEAAGSFGWSSLRCRRRHAWPRPVGAQNLGLCLLLSSGHVYTTRLRTAPSNYRRHCGPPNLTEPHCQFLPPGLLPPPP